jgi:hypothetical protein
MEFLEDVMQKNAKNVYWDEYQLVFVKGNRNIPLNPP